jgi:four helix bundle protein
MAIKTYRDMDVWQKSMELVSTIYLATKAFPREEIYALTSQMRRAAISIPSNIAEGRSKRSTREFMRFVNMAAGSVAELETQLMIGEKLGYLSSKQLFPLLEKVAYIGRMLNNLHSGLEKRLVP